MILIEIIIAIILFKLNHELTTLLQFWRILLTTWIASFKECSVSIFWWLWIICRNRWGNVSITDDVWNGRWIAWLSRHLMWIGINWLCTRLVYIIRSTHAFVTCYETLTIIHVWRLTIACQHAICLCLLSRNGLRIWLWQFDNGLWIRLWLILWDHGTNLSTQLRIWKGLWSRLERSHHCSTSPNHCTSWIDFIWECSSFLIDHHRLTLFFASWPIEVELIHLVNFVWIHCVHQAFEHLTLFLVFTKLEI